MAHIPLLWGSTRAVDLRVRAARKATDRSLTGGLTDRLTRTDDTAALRFDALAEAYEGAEADERVGEVEGARLEEREERVGVSLDEYRAAKEKMADIASEAAAVAIGAAITALSGGTAAPVAVALITTAATGTARIAIHEAIQGDDYDAEDAMAQLAVDLLVTAATGYMDEMWGVVGGAADKALRGAPAGRKLLLAREALHEGSEKLLGPLGIKLAEAAVDTATDDVKDVALEMLQPDTYKNGWDASMENGLDELRAKVASLPDQVLEETLQTLAEELGERAGEATRGESGSEPSERQLGVEDAPDPHRDLNGYRAYLSARLGQLGHDVLATTTQQAVSGLAEEGIHQVREGVLTGDRSVDADALMRVLGAAGKSGLKSGVKGVGKSLLAARKDQQTAQTLAAAHDARMKVLQTIPDAGLDPQERAYFEQWSQTVPFAPGVDDLEGEEREAAEKAAVRMEIARFHRTVWGPLQGQLEDHRRTWGADLSAAQREEYETWVLSDPTQATRRVKTTPAQFTERLENAREQITAAKDSVGYGTLDPHERAWYDHAASNPAEFADLTSSDASLAVSVDTLEQAQAFRESVQEVEQTLGHRRLAEVATVVDTDRQMFIEAHADEILKDVKLSPNDQVGNLRTVQAAFEQAWAGSKEARIERLYQPA